MTLFISFIILYYYFKLTFLPFSGGNTSRWQVPVNTTVRLIRHLAVPNVTIKTRVVTHHMGKILSISQQIQYFYH